MPSPCSPLWPLWSQVASASKNEEPLLNLSHYHSSKDSTPIKLDLILAQFDLTTLHNTTKTVAKPIAKFLESTTSTGPFVSRKSP